MATYTTYLNLEKPTTSETFNLLKMNQNWDKIDAGVSSLNSKFAYETETLTGFDTTKITEGVAIKVGQVVLLRVTMKEGLAATWHNDLNIGLPNKFRPSTAIFGSHRVNAGADISKNAICILNTNGTIQFLCDQSFAASVPFEFVYPLASF